MCKAEKAQDFGAIGVEIKSTKKTQSGTILLKVKGGIKHEEKLAKDLKMKLGDDKIVRRPEKRCTAMKLGIREWISEISEPQIKDSLNKALGSIDEIIKFVVRNNIGGKGNRYARFNLLCKGARRLQETGRLKIECSSSSRIKVLMNSHSRCYRCLEPRHLAKNCSGPERSGCCFRCFKSDHHAVGCSFSKDRGKEHETAKPAGLNTRPPGLGESERV